MSPPPIKRSLSDGDLSSSNKKAKYLFLGTDSAIVNPPPFSWSISDWVFPSSSKKNDKHQYAEDRCLFLGPESAIVNPPPFICSISDEEISSRTKKDKHHDDEDPSLSLPLRANISVKTTATPAVFTPFPGRDPKFYLDIAWGKLKPAIRSIFLDEPQCFSCSEIFNAVHDAWWANSGEALFKLIEDECGTHISASIQSLEGQCNDGSSVILPLEKVWLDYRRKLLFLCNIFGSEVRRVGGDTLWDVGLKLFSNRLYLASEVRDNVISSILVLIKDQRSGKSVDMSKLDNITDVFIGDSFDYLLLFGKPFLECAAEFYSAEAKQALAQCDISQYLKLAERRLHEEKKKCNSLYFFIEEESVIEVVEREFLTVHASAILEKGFARLMDERCEDDLQRMYVLFSEANLVDHLNVSLSSYILETGKKILAKGSSLEEFKASVDKIWLSYFLEDDLLVKTIDKCFKDLGLPWKDRFASEYI